MHFTRPKFQKTLVDDGFQPADPHTKEVYQEVEAFARQGQPVVIFGPTGAGKEFLARHYYKILTETDFYSQWEAEWPANFNKIFQVGPRPGSYLFLLLLGGFLLMLSLKINPWLAVVGAIAIAFSSYNFIIILAGHNTKVVAIAYAAPVLAGIFISFRGKKLLGAAITKLFLLNAIVP